MAEVSSSVSLTEAQSGLWYGARLDPHNPIFNTGQYIELRGGLDEAAFIQAVNQVGEEAEALSLRFSEEEGLPLQALEAEARPVLRIVDCTRDAEPKASALAWIAADMARPIDPLSEALALQRLYRLGADSYIWAQQVHHLANDGYGMVMLTTRVAELYQAALTGKPTRGKPFAPLADLWAEDESYRVSDQRKDDAAWWSHVLHGMDDVVGMAPGRAQSAHSFHRFECAMDEETRTILLERAKSIGLPWPDALTALVSAYIRRFTATDEVVVGVPHMGRFGSVAARIPAMVMNVLPLRVMPDEQEPVEAFIARVGQDMAAARQHARYRSEQVRRDIGLLGGTRRLHGPLVNVQPYDRPPQFYGLEAELHVTGTGPVDEINFTFRGDGRSSLTLEVDANPDIFSAQAVAAHGKRLEVFLNKALKAETLAEVPTATPEEALAELEEYNQTAHPIPDASLAELLERAMLEAPDREALRFDGQSLTYTQLDQRTQALAMALRARLPASLDGPPIVAVYLPRSLELVIALVAVLRAGAAYLPLDMDHPAQRIATILKSAQPFAILAHDDPLDVFGADLCPVADWPEYPADSELPLPLPDAPAYVIYTSGSTGDPKGVVVSHIAIVNRLLWMREHYGFGPDDRILQKTPATFDVSVWEFFLAFLSGGVLVVAPPGAHRDPAKIAQIMRDEAITTLHFVPSMLGAFLASPDSLDIQVRRVFCSGEELPADLRDAFHARINGALHNLYGPTEAAVDVSYWPAARDDISMPVPIGHAVWNTRLVLLDEQLRPVPKGMVGHLYLGGIQLAQGYLGRADLTEERFISDPFHAGERLYMTGDIARRREDGAIVFLGRADHQVKIRGLRIELGEIEAAVASYAGVKAHAVIACDGRLVAYVVPNAGYDVDVLRRILALRLPDYMVPSAFVALEVLPVTTNGKLDRKALPEPVFEGSGGGAPATPTGQLLARLYGEILEREAPIGARDDFFALGGDSLSAVRLSLRIHEELGFDPGLAGLFEHPDVEGLAAWIDAFSASLNDAEQATGAIDLADSGLAPLITLLRGDADLPPLFVVHPAGGICWGYRGLVSQISPRRTVYGLQSPALDPDVSAPADIDALARDYARRMIEAFPKGPYHVMGWSVGGIIAQALAVELEKLGRAVGAIVMLDSYPAECWRAQAEPTREQAVRALLAVAGYDPETLPHLTTQDDILQFLREGASPLGTLPERAQEGVVRVVLDTNRLIRAHHHKAYNGPLIHIRAENDHKDRPELQSSLWRDYASAVDCVSVPFLHSQLTSPAAAKLIAPAVQERMAAYEKVPA